MSSKNKQRKAWKYTNNMKLIKNNTQEWKSIFKTTTPKK